MSKILVIGCGGIGSYLIEHLCRAGKTGQINDEITIVDFDSVEPKNLSYQNFKTDDLFKNKAQVLGERYNFMYLTHKVEKPSDLKEYDWIIL
jgi:tRNA A37 threonylcarbamoyladenosine dehydratase